MKVIMLTGNLEEAEAHAKLAGLAMHDVIIPQTAAFIHGVRITDDDLIVEFPSFTGHPHEVGIRQGLHVKMAMHKCNPPWERITG